MRIKRKTILQWSLLIILILIIRVWQQQDLLNDNAPVFNSNTLSGEILSSTDDKPVLIHFWATWCAVCNFENDNIQRVAKYYKVLNIAISSGSDADVIKHAKQHNMKLDNIINDDNQSLARIFGIQATPTSFIVFKNKIKFIEIGYTTTIGILLRLWVSQWL